MDDNEDIMDYNDDYFWIQDAFDNELVHFDGCGTWKVQRKLSEKERRIPSEYFNEKRKGYKWEPSEAHAVYDCVQVEGQHIGKQGILKVRIQYVAPPS